MHHIIYMSRATKPYSEEQLQQLLLQARLSNQAAGLTGVLLYGNGQFVQVLEGEEASVRALYEHVKRDPRHQNVTAYADKAIEQRAFADWSMAYHATSTEQLQELMGYLAPGDFAVDTSRMRQADAQLVDLLRSFVLP
jgi:hypothetical protein